VTAAVLSDTLAKEKVLEKPHKNPTCLRRRWARSDGRCRALTPALPRWGAQPLTANQLVAATVEIPNKLAGGNTPQTWA